MVMKGVAMNIVISIECENAAFDGDPLQELRRILLTVPGKVAAILRRDEGAVCCAAESEDSLRDINGNVVGTISVFR